MSPYILPEDAEEEHHAPASTSSQVSKALTRSSIRPFTLFEGDKLVIPQKPLYALFGYAVKVLSEYPRSVLQLQPNQDNQELYYYAERTKAFYENQLQQLDDLTKCIILQNPEHTKALNLRKSLLLHHITESDSKDRTLHLIQAELNFTKLTLGIAANAKMGTLWHHRKWLYAIRHESEQNERVNTGHDGYLYRHSLGKKLYHIDPIPLPTIELQLELDLINTCAERYPRNYQAWAYRYWITKGQLLAIPKHPQRDSVSLYTQNNESPILTQEYEATERHLSTHIGDHTAAVHLLNIITLAVRSCHNDLGERLLQMAKSFAVDFVTRYPYKETPWLVLRGVLDIQGTIKPRCDGKLEDIEDESLQQVLSLAANIRNSRPPARDRGNLQSEKDSIEWEEHQDTAARKYAARTLFYVSCRFGKTGHPSLGSKEASKVLGQCV